MNPKGFAVGMVLLVTLVMSVTLVWYQSFVWKQMPLENVDPSVEDAAV